MSALFVWRNWRLLCLGLVLVPGLILFAGLLVALYLPLSPGVALADSPTIRYVAAAPVGKDDGRDCTDSTAPCATIGRALEQAEDLDIIRVAEGTYTENLVITRTVTLEGGYETFGWARSLDRSATVDGNQHSPAVSV